MLSKQMSIKSQTGPMKVFHAFFEEYINQEHMGLVCIMSTNLASSLPCCVYEKRYVQEATLSSCHISGWVTKSTMIE